MSAESAHNPSPFLLVRAGLKAYLGMFIWIVLAASLLGMLTSGQSDATAIMFEAPILLIGFSIFARLHNHPSAVFPEDGYVAYLFSVGIITFIIALIFFWTGVTVTHWVMVAIVFVLMLGFIPWKRISR